MKNPDLLSVRMADLGFPHEVHTPGQAVFEIMHEHENYTVIAAVKGDRATPRIFVGHYRRLVAAEEVVAKAKGRQNILMVEFANRAQRKQYGKPKGRKHREQ